MEIVKRKNKTTYRETVYIDGIRHRSQTFERKTDAKNWKNNLLSKREKAKVLGDDFQVIEKKTLDVFSKQWVENKIKPQRTKSTYSSYSRIIRIHLLPFFGKIYLNQMNTELVDDFVKNLFQSDHNAKGINNILQVLKSIYIAAKRQKVIRDNPIEDYAMMKLIKQPPVYWNEIEIRQFLLAAFGHHLYPLYVVALNTGMRRGELGGLAWDMVDFKRNIIQISRIRDRFGLRSTTKNGTSRDVPMNPIVRAILLDLCHRRTEKTVYLDVKGNPVHLVFPNNEGGVVCIHHLYRDFKRMQKKAKVSRGIRFHDLRHCFASHFMMNGGNIYDLQKILGHSKTDMTQIYAHLSPEHLSGVTHILNFGNMESEKVAHKQPTEILEVI